MFTRYTGVDIPQNYSGNRFRKDLYEDTEMKVHSSSTEGAVKSSVSPSFEQRLNYQSNVMKKDETIENATENDIFYQDEEENNKEQPHNDSEQEKNDNIQHSKSILKELSPFSEYLKNIKSDDLLLIALIIFLASEKNGSNGDVIILLALLLIYHA